MKLNLMRNKEHFSRFCAAMEKVMGCRSPHCEKTCWAWAVRDIQKLCNEEGMGIDAAARKWAETGLKHTDGEDIWCNLLDVDNLDIVRNILNEKGRILIKEER